MRTTGVLLIFLGLFWFTYAINLPSGEIINGQYINDVISMVGNRIIHCMISLAIIISGVTVLAVSFARLSDHLSIVGGRIKAREERLSAFVRHGRNDQLEIDEDAILELAIQYKYELPDKNASEIIVKKSLEIAGIVDEIPDELKFHFEEYLKYYLKSICEK